MYCIPLTRLRSLAKGRASKLLCTAFLLGIAATAHAESARTKEIHHRLADTSVVNEVALTLDACDGHFDFEVIDTLVKLRVPTTIFATRKWIAKNPKALATLRSHPELFQIENHGAEHVPAVLGRDASVYGLKAAGSVPTLQREVEGGADAIASTGATRPIWFRGATARYDAESLKEIARLGYRVAGFSVNADVGATLPKRAIVQRLLAVRSGDIIIAHMNKPASETAEALQEALPALLARGVRFVKLEARDVVTVD